MKLGDAAKIARGDYWVIPRYLDSVRTMSYTDQLGALTTILTRPPRVRVNTFSASSAGRCMRERQLAYLGAKRLEPDGAGQNIFANGDWVHLRWQVAGLTGGWLAAAEVPVYKKEYQLTGTMDGLLVTGEGLELKSINDRGFSQVGSYGPKPEHREQVHSYMLAADLDRFRIVYENKNTNEPREFVVERDPVLMDKVKADLDMLNQAQADQRLLPMLPECEVKEGRYAKCLYRESCPIARFASVAQRRSPIRVVSSRPST